MAILGSWLIMCHFWINFFIMVIILQCFYIGLNSNLPNGRILMGSFGTDVYIVFACTNSLPWPLNLAYLLF